VAVKEEGLGGVEKEVPEARLARFFVVQYTE
jgi:hypothetical protein